MPVSFAGRAALAVSIAILLCGAALVFWKTADIFLLVFAAVLLAVFLRTVSRFVQDHTRLTEGWALATVIVGLGGLLLLAGITMAPSIITQLGILRERVPQGFEDLRAQLGVDAAVLPSVEQIAPLAPRIFSTTFGIGASAAVILAVGIYLSMAPQKYKSGVVALFPKARRRRAGEVIDAIGETLRLWLMGKIVGMAFVGTATTIGLWALGHPLAFSLGLLAGLLDFIPNIGPLLAFIPAILISLMASPTEALYVAILYTAVQGVESYLVEPWMYQRNVDLPPALTISGQVFFSILLGFLGLLIATPLLAVGLALVKQLYVEEVVEQQPTPLEPEAPPRAA